MSASPGLEIGRRCEIGSHTFERDEIIAFAERYDPQRFHLSEETASDWPFGRLAASGWHTAAVWMRLFVLDWQRREAEGASLPILGPSPGFEDMRWARPVYVGDTITYSTEGLALRPTRSRPGWHLLTSRNEGINQEGALVFSFLGKVFFKSA